MQTRGLCGDAHPARGLAVPPVVATITGALHRDRLLLHQHSRLLRQEGAARELARQRHSLPPKQLVITRHYARVMPHDDHLFGPLTVAPGSSVHTPATPWPWPEVGTHHLHELPRQSVVFWHLSCRMTFDWWTSTTHRLAHIAGSQTPPRGLALAEGWDRATLQTPCKVRPHDPSPRSHPSHGVGVVMLTQQADLRSFQS
jgi:hypothetical protein